MDVISWLLSLFSCHRHKFLPVSAIFVILEQLPDSQNPCYR